MLAHPQAARISPLYRQSIVPRKCRRFENQLRCLRDDTVCLDRIRDGDALLPSIQNSNARCVFDLLAQGGVLAPMLRYASFVPRLLTIKTPLLLGESGLSAANWISCTRRNFLVNVDGTPHKIIFGDDESGCKGLPQGKEISHRIRHLTPHQRTESAVCLIHLLGRRVRKPCIIIIRICKI